MHQLNCDGFKKYRQRDGCLNSTVGSNSLVPFRVFDPKRCYLLKMAKCE